MQILLSLLSWRRRSYDRPFEPPGHSNLVLSGEATTKYDDYPLCRPQLIGMLCGWFRPIEGTLQEGNPRPLCVLPHRTATPYCPYVTTHGTSRTAGLYYRLTHVVSRTATCQMLPTSGTPEDYGEAHNTRIVASNQIP